jgi:hypothetical protein
MIFGPEYSRLSILVSNLSTFGPSADRHTGYTFGRTSTDITTEGFRKDFMDLTTLKDILAAFADDPANVVMEKGRLMVQIQDEVITATTSHREGMLYVKEDENSIPASRWVASRIAQLDLVADRLTTIFPKNPKFIAPRGALLDQIDEAPKEENRNTDNALETAGEFLGRRPGGMCSVLYLTSNAGEGKTTLINELAHNQAVAYRQRKTDWLLLPFSLGGNPFLRLDNVIAAGLLNQLRIRRFFLEGLIHLIRLGFIVPALDGFEEVFVETSGEAVSSFGNLIRDMRGEGTLLIAARTAYFEYKRLDRQAKLFDRIPNFEVGFGRLALMRWERREFLQFCQLNGISNPESLYSDLAGRLGPDNALLTRAFFISKIVDLAKTTNGLQFLREIEPEVQANFRPFIDKILEREVSEKWLDKFNQPATPLLSVEEHHQLLRLLAEEMWLNKRGSLPRSTCDDYADIYCEERKKSPPITRQVKERLNNHALLRADSSGSQISFDHDRFRDFFMGEQLGQYIRDRAAADIRKIMRVDSISGATLDAAVAHALHGGGDPVRIMKAIVDVASAEGPTSFVRENAGALCLRLAGRVPPGSQPIEVSGMSFPQDALAGRGLERLNFRESYFRSTIFSGVYKDVRFEKCEFEHIEVTDEFSFTGIVFADCQIHGITITRGDEAIDHYDPGVIDVYLSRSSASFIRSAQQLLPTASIPEDDEEVKIIRKLTLIFRRATQVSGSVIKLRLGVLSNRFFEGLERELLAHSVLRSIPNRGGGSQKRFALGRSMSDIAEALANARGDYATFLALIDQSATLGAGSEDDADH